MAEDGKMIEAQVTETTVPVMDEAKMKITQLQQEEASAYWESILESIQDGFWVFDRKWRCTYMNHQQSQLIGKRKDDVLGNNLWDLFPDWVDTEVHRQLHQAVSEQTLVHFEYFYPMWQGWVEFRVYPSAQGVSMLTTDITARKQAEAVQLDRQQLIQQLVEMSPGLLYLYDIVEQRNIYINTRSLDLLGYPSETVLAMGANFMAQVIHPEDLPRIQAHFEQLNATEDGRFVDIEYRMRHINGEWRWFSSRDRVLTRTAEGQVRQILGTAQDITERKRTEEALRDREQQLKIALQTAKLGTWQHDLVTGILSCSEQCKANFGLPPDAEFSHQTLFAALHPEDCDSASQTLRERVQAAIHRAIEERTDYEVEERCFWPDGSLHWLIARGRLIYDSDGTPIRLVGVTLDITDRKRTEEALRHSEERFQLVAQATNDVMWDFNALTHEMWWSEQVQLLFGYRPEDLGTDMQGWAERVHPGDIERVQTHYETCLSSQECFWTDEYRFRRADDSYAYLLDRAYIIRDVSGKAVRVVGLMTDITERKQAEESLRNSERLYRAIGETIDYGIWVCDPDGRNIYASESFLQLVGLTQEQCSEFGWADVLHPDDAPATIAAWKECVRSGNFWDIEHRFRGVDGNWHSLLARGVPVRDENGEIICWAGINLDISRQKRAEAKLRESEARFRTLADSVPVLVWVNGVNGGCQFVNKAYLEFFGKTLEEVVGFGWRVHVHPDDQEQYMSAYLAALAERKPFRAQVRVQHADGQYRWLDSYALPRFSPAGEFMGYIGTSPDITEIKEAEEALRQSEERFRLATRAVAGVVYDWDVQSGRVYRSEGLYRLIGVRPEDAPQTRDWWLGRIHPDDLTHLQSIGDSIQTGSEERFETEYRVRHEDGRWIDVWDCSYLIRDENGQLIRIVGSTTDITEREQLLARERATREEAEAANRLKDEFLAILSHELRSPLNPILGWTRLLRTRKFDDKARDKALETIERNAKLQTQLIEDLLDVSRILRGKTTLNVCPVNLAHTIEAAIETVCLAAQAKGIHIQTQLNSAMEPISGDPSRLQQIVWNLLSNAVKFTPSGGKVDVCLEQIDAYAQIQVKDTGKGIAKEFLPHVFDYFRQEDSTTTRAFGGLGLGLAIVRHLTELHGGTVQAESLGEGQGATFTVRLPRMTTVARISPNNQPSTNTLDLSGLRILAVDDEADMRDLVKFSLNEYGANVRVAASAAEALLIFEEFKPDVFVCDIGMPEVDGYTLMRQVRAMLSEQAGRIPGLSEALPKAIALTAYAGDMNQQQAFAVGFQMHISKPVEPAELAKAIITLLRTDSSISSSRLGDS